MSSFDADYFTAEQRQLYEQSYRQLGIQAQRRYPNEEFVRFMGRHFFHIPEAARSEISILELGCGTGSNLWMVAKEVFDAHGIDFSPAAVSLCKETMVKWQVEFQCRVGNMLDLEYPDGQFDVVADVFSATHLPYEQHKRMYLEAHRVLKTGGRFFSYHPSDQSYSFHHSGSELYDRYTVTDIVDERSPYKGNGIMCFLPPEECRSLLEEAGFKQVRIEQIGRTYHNGEIYFEFLSVEAAKP